MADYSKIKDKEFDNILLSKLQTMSAKDIISIPGIYEILSEHLNNDILDAWKEEQEASKELEALD